MEQAAKQELIEYDTNKLLDILMFSLDGTSDEYLCQILNRDYDMEFKLTTVRPYRLRMRRYARIAYNLRQCGGEDTAAKLENHWQSAFASHDWTAEQKERIIELGAKVPESELMIKSTSNRAASEERTPSKNRAKTMPTSEPMTQTTASSPPASATADAGSERKLLQNIVETQKQMKQDLTDMRTELRRFVLRFDALEKTLRRGSMTG